MALPNPAHSAGLPFLLDSGEPVAKPTGLSRLLSAIGEASLTLFVGLPPGRAPALKPSEIVRSALESLLQEPCDLTVFSGGTDTVAVVVTPRSHLAFDPILTQGIVDQLRACLEPTFGTGVVITPLAYVTPVGAREENLAFLGELLDTIVNRKLGAQFMPIVNLNVGALYGYEALIRAPQEGLLNRMGLMFATADRARLVSWLDIACQEQCFAQAAAAGAREHLFFNMDAEGLVHLQMSERSLADRAREMGISPSRVVMEITERQAVEDYPRLRAYIEEVRAQGFKIAIDDAGAGYNSLEAIAEIRPEFVKIGRPLIRTIEGNGARRALLRCLSDYTMQIGTSLIAEGIETYDELATVLDLGVTYGQGYLLGRPDDRFRNVRRSAQDMVASLAERRRKRTCGRSYTVGDAATNGLTIEAASPVEQIVRKFSRNSDSATIVLLEDDRPVGILTRSELEQAMVSGSVPVDSPLPAGLVRRPSLVESEQSIEDAAMMASHRGVDQMVDDLVVVRNGAYRGMVTVPCLLEAMTNLRIRQSVRANAVSGLPGRIALEETLLGRLAASTPTAVVQVEVLGLAELNAVEGYQRGDELLHAVGRVIEDARAAHGGDGSLAAHTHGGLFYLLAAPPGAREAAHAIRDAFSQVAAPICAATPTGATPLPLSVRITAIRARSDRAPAFADVERALRDARQQAGAEAEMVLARSLAAA